MCSSRLPNEVTSYRPCGMLDRDQRTAFTISKKRRGPSIFLTTTTTMSSCISSADSLSELNYENPNQKCSKCKSVKCKSMIPTVDMPTTAKDLSRRKCDFQQLKDSTSVCYQSRTKLVNCVLAFLCIWIVTIHHTCAYPLSQMSEHNDPDALRCKAIRGALEHAIDQANLTGNYTRNLVANYTQLRFKNTTEGVHQLWITRQPHFTYGRDMEQILPKYFEGELEEKHYAHLRGPGVPTESELANEFERIYVFLQTLKQVFSVMAEDHEHNTDILKHFDNNFTIFNITKHLFDEQLRYSKADIAELENAMFILKIQPPALKNVMIYGADRKVGEWVATREYLKLNLYMRGIYKILLQRCS